MVAFIGRCFYRVQPQGGPLLVLVVGLLLWRPVSLGVDALKFLFLLCCRSLLLGKFKSCFLWWWSVLLCSVLLQLCILLPAGPHSLLCFLLAGTSHLHFAEAPCLLFPGALYDLFFLPLLYSVSTAVLVSSYASCLALHFSLQWFWLCSYSEHSLLCCVAILQRLLYMQNF